VKTKEAYAKTGGNPQLIARLEATQDVKKWEKKFIQVFTANRGILDLSQDASEKLEVKNMLLNPQPNLSSRVSHRILSTNHKFWIVYLRLIADRLNDFAKATLRARLFGDAETGAPGLFPPSNSPVYEELFNEIGALIDAQKLSNVTEHQPEHLPSFGVPAQEK